MTEVLREPFENLLSWTQVGATPTTKVTIGTARNGNGAVIPISTIELRYRIPAANESDTVIVGGAFKVSSLTGNRILIDLLSDDGATQHTRVRVQTDGSISVLRGTATGLGSTAAGVITAGTFYFIELQAKLHDTTGTVTLRVNGTQLINATGVDTRNAGTKAVYDTVLLNSSSGVHTIDDLYVRTGAAETFAGDLAVAAPPSQQRLARMGVRVLTQNTPVGPARLARFSVRALLSNTERLAAGTATMTFGGTATGTVITAFMATSRTTFIAAATGSIDIEDAAASAGMSFRSFGQLRQRVRLIGRWFTSGSEPVPLVSSEFTPRAGALLVCLYALKVDGVGTFLAGGGVPHPGEWWSTGGEVAPAVTDTFANHSPWRSYGGNTHGLAGQDIISSWLAMVGYTKIGPSPGPGRVTVVPQPHPGHRQYARMTIVEVTGWSSTGRPDSDQPWDQAGVFLGGWYNTWQNSSTLPAVPHQTVQASEQGPSWDNATTFGVLLSDGADTLGTTTDPLWFRRLDKAIDSMTGGPEHVVLNDPLESNANWSTPGGGAVPGMTTTAGRTGNCMRLTTFNVASHVTPTTGRTPGFRVDLWFRVSSPTGADRALVQLRAGPANVLTLMLTTAGSLQARQGGTTGTWVGGTTGVLANTWHHLQGVIVLDDMVGVIEASLDGVQFANGYGLDTNPGIVPMEMTEIWLIGPSTGTVDFDDLVLTAITSAPGMSHGVTVASAMFRTAGLSDILIGDPEAEAMDPYEWSALPLTGNVHLAAFIRIPEDAHPTPPPPTPIVYPETMVEFQDETGAWVDITCDVRTIDIDSGRNETLDQFSAATLTLTMANFTGVYSPWPPDSVWAQAGRYRTDVPIRVNMFNDEPVGGIIERVRHPLFTGTTDAINDSWPGAGHDAMVTITATDGFKKLNAFEGNVNG